MFRFPVGPRTGKRPIRSPNKIKMKKVPSKHVFAPGFADIASALADDEFADKLGDVRAPSSAAAPPIFAFASAARVLDGKKNHTIVPPQ